MNGERHAFCKCEVVGSRTFHQHELVIMVSHLRMLHLTLLVREFVRTVTKNAIHVRILKDGGIMCDGFIGPAILFAGEHHARRYLLTDITELTHTQLPRDAKLVVHPTVLLTP